MFTIEKMSSGNFKIMSGTEVVEEFDNYIDAKVRVLELNTGKTLEAYKERQKNIYEYLVEP